jgi:calcineurin-like phosphoesterase family protein
MTNFVISDTHFGHTNSWEKFKKADGSPLRPFTSNEEMDETMIERWNAKVKENDVVYHLGDVVINKRYLPLLDRLNGSKRLIMGNHDIFGHEEYLKYFKKIAGVRVFVDQFIFSHIPLHPDSVTDRFKVNVHGHLHANEVTWQVEKWFSDGQPNGYEGTETVTEPDPRYLCVSVEHTNFEPLSFEEVQARIDARWGKAGYSPKAKAWGNGSGPG